MAEEVADAEAGSRARIVRETALALGEWLQGAKLLEKKIWQLQLEELERIVDVSVSAFLVADSRERARRNAEPLPDPPDLTG